LCNLQYIYIYIYIYIWHIKKINPKTFKSIFVCKPNIILLNKFHQLEMLVIFMFKKVEFALINI